MPAWLARSQGPVLPGPLLVEILRAVAGGALDELAGADPDCTARGGSRRRSSRIRRGVAGGFVPARRPRACAAQTGPDAEPPAGVRGAGRSAAATRVPSLRCACASRVLSRSAAASAARVRSRSRAAARASRRSAARMRCLAARSATASASSWEGLASGWLRAATSLGRGREAVSVRAWDRPAPGSEKSGGDRGAAVVRFDGAGPGGAGAGRSSALLREAVRLAAGSASASSCAGKGAARFRAGLAGRVAPACWAAGFAGGAAVARRVARQTVRTGRPFGQAAPRGACLAAASGDAAGTVKGPSTRRTVRVGLRFEGVAMDPCWPGRPRPTLRFPETRSGHRGPP